ncbi:hypothetical protein Ddye_002103 [Dipteronia dyeriana]|uniref:Reverse transcriptase domain-containing protein n=1 Tax=Dipteronia dyeriana TaxID=168575 RepID=A0AAD9XPW0_9ROSI|nr:hypothetical protein Ddye_002103 [Dipteronia dyeriana]
MSKTQVYEGQNRVGKTETKTEYVNKTHYQHRSTYANVVKEGNGRCFEERPVMSWVGQEWEGENRNQAMVRWESYFEHGKESDGDDTGREKEDILTSEKKNERIMVVRNFRENISKVSRKLRSDIGVVLGKGKGGWQQQSRTIPRIIFLVWREEAHTMEEGQNKRQMDNQQHLATEKSLDLFVDLRGQGSDQSNYKNLDNQDIQTIDSLHKGNMKKVIWNLEEEISKVIEEGVSRGLDLKVRQKNNTKGTTEQAQSEENEDQVMQSSSYWDLEVEITKILQTEVALGFDYNAMSWNVRGLGKVEKRRKKRKKESCGFCTRQSFQIPWVLGGDFNPVLHTLERRGGEFNQWSTRAFNSFILQLEEVDMSLRGVSFTWSNIKVNGNWVRLDRFLVSPSVLTWFPDLVQVGLPRTISDHCTVTIGISKDKGGPRLFRFNNEWLEDRELMGQVKKEWVGSNLKGSSSFTISSKRRRSKKIVKKWAADRTVNRSNSKDLEVRLAVVDEKPTAVGWSDELRKERLEIFDALWKEIKREEKEWSQKSRIKWLLEGDQNTKKIHSVASSRRRHNFIEKLFFEGILKSNSEEIREGAAIYFENLFKNMKWSRPRITGLPLQRLSDSDRALLEEDFSLEEVWLAVSSCDENKALEPDGFNLNFIKENWKVIKDDFMCFMVDFYHNGVVVKELNQTFTALIPKCVKPEVMKDVRPISLVCSMYKILAKVLANRLKRVIGSVVGEHQMAFVQDRQLLDSFVVTDEIIHHWKKSKDGGLVVKLDFEKSYDSLDHNFLDNIISDMGFGEKWREWMISCIFTPVFSVLVNESPSRQFRLERGLRQGNPLSPFLFNIPVEGLSALFKKALVFSKAVSSLLEQGSKLAQILQECVKVIVGDENIIRLWRDVKVEGESMMEAFPRIFALTINKEGSLSENLWLDCMNWWGVSTCFSGSLQDWWRGWGGLCPKKNLRRAWVSMFFAIVWTIWESRNDKVFKLEAAILKKAMDLVKFRVAWWFKNLGKGSSESISLMIIDIAERCLDQDKVKVPKMGDWIPPQLEILKFNVDGSARGSPGQAGIGGSSSGSEWEGVVFVLCLCWLSGCYNC